MILSPDPKIDNLIFRAMPTRPKKVERAIRIGNSIVCVDADGAIYTDSRLAGNFAHCLGVWPWLEDTLKALVKLGVLDQSQVDRHMEAAKAAEERKSRKYAVDDMDRIEKKYGIKFTAKQRKAVSG